MNQDSNIRIQHEFYKPKRFAKGLKNFKKLFIVSIYVSFVVIIVSFAENNTMAFASDLKQPAGKTKKSKMLPDEKMLSYYTSVIEDKDIAKYAIKYTNEYNIDTSLFVALMKVESQFNPQAMNYNYNGSIDRGLCQLNNRSFPDMKSADFYDPELNIKTACEFLKWCFDNSENSVVMGLAFYNAGYGSVSRDQVGDMTLNYIDKILNYKNDYESELEIVMNN